MLDLTENENPLVSVVMLAYNHDKYIGQAIEGVLAQKSTFPFELIIANDCSTDDTLKICREYQQKNPNIIRILPRDKNLGMSKNFSDALQNSKGKYIAPCEGDDYWINPNKLERQVRFLENNPAYSGACSNVKRFIETQNIYETDIRYHDFKEEEDFSPEILLLQGLIYTPTFIFRNKLFDPKIIENFLVCDIYTELLVSSKGIIKFHNEIDAVYRIHQNGAMHSLIPKNPHRFFKEQIEFLDYFNNATNEKYKIQINQRKSYLKILLALTDQSNSLVIKLSHGLQYFLNKETPKTLQKLKNTFRLVFPNVTQKLKQISQSKVENL